MNIRPRLAAAAIAVLAVAAPLAVMTPAAHAAAPPENCTKLELTTVEPSGANAAAVGGGDISNIVGTWSPTTPGGTLSADVLLSDASCKKLTYVLHIADASNGQEFATSPLTKLGDGTNPLSFSYAAPSDYTNDQLYFDADTGTQRHQSCISFYAEVKNASGVQLDRAPNVGFGQSCTATSPTGRYS